MYLGSHKNVANFHVHVHDVTYAPEKCVTSSALGEGVFGLGGGIFIRKKKHYTTIDLAVNVT